LIGQKHGILVYQEHSSSLSIAYLSLIEDYIMIRKSESLSLLQSKWLLKSITKQVYSNLFNINYRVNDILSAIQWV